MKAKQKMAEHMVNEAKTKRLKKVQGSEEAEKWRVRVKQIKNKACTTFVCFGECILNAVHLGKCRERWMVNLSEGQAEPTGTSCSHLMKTWTWASLCRPFCLCWMKVSLQRAKRENMRVRQAALHVKFIQLKAGSPFFCVFLALLPHI